MDNVYRRDHEMPYISDEAVMAQQKGIKKAIREYNEAMPFEPEKVWSVWSVQESNIRKMYILSRRSTANTEAISKSERIFMPTLTV